MSTQPTSPAAAQPKRSTRLSAATTEWAMLIAEVERVFDDVSYRKQGRFFKEGRLHNLSLLFNLVCCISCVVLLCVRWAQDDPLGRNNKCHRWSIANSDECEGTSCSQLGWEQLRHQCECQAPLSCVWEKNDTAYNGTSLSTLFNHGGSCMYPPNVLRLSWPSCWPISFAEEGSTNSGSSVAGGDKNNDGGGSANILAGVVGCTTFIMFFGIVAYLVSGCLCFRNSGGDTKDSNGRKKHRYDYDQSLVMLSCFCIAMCICAFLFSLTFITELPAWINIALTSALLLLQGLISGIFLVMLSMVHDESKDLEKTVGFRRRYIVTEVFIAFLGVSVVAQEANSFCSPEVFVLLLAIARPFLFGVLGVAGVWLYFRNGVDLMEVVVDPFKSIVRRRVFPIAIGQPFCAVMILLFKLNSRESLYSIFTCCAMQVVSFAWSERKLQEWWRSARRFCRSLACCRRRRDLESPPLISSTEDGPEARPDGGTFNSSDSIEGEDSDDDSSEDIPPSFRTFVQHYGAQTQHVSAKLSQEVRKQSELHHNGGTGALGDTPDLTGELLQAHLPDGKVYVPPSTHKKQKSTCGAGYLEDPDSTEGRSTPSDSRSE